MPTLIRYFINMEQRIEKKFVFLPGDKKKVDLLIIEGFFKNLSDSGFYKVVITIYLFTDLAFYQVFLY